jgi:xanthine dehydrogenase accessory factor
MNNIVLIKGAGDLATGVAYRLFKCGLQVVMTEISRPTVVRRSVSFAEAVYEQSHTVEEVTAQLVPNWQAAKELFEQRQIPVLVDPTATEALKLKPSIIVDAIIAKRNTGTKITDAPLVIGLGPGFTAGEDVHAVVETNRGHYLGRVMWQGSAEPNTGVPGPVNGYTNERLLKAPATGVFTPCVTINSAVKAGDILGYVESYPLRAEISGRLRGLIKGGIWVKAGMKIGDIDPRCELGHCYTISDKALAIAGGVLEAILCSRGL